MSSLDQFVEDPVARMFMEISFQVHETTGAWRIPSLTRSQLMGNLALTQGQTAAYSYLAENRAREQWEKIQEVQL